MNVQKYRIRTTELAQSLRRFRRIIQELTKVQSEK